MQTAMPIQSAAMFHALHVRSPCATGARSVLLSELVVDCPTSDLDDPIVRLWAPIPEELPGVADLPDHVQIEIRDHDLVAVA